MRHPAIHEDHLLTSRLHRCIEELSCDDILPARVVRDVLTELKEFLRDLQAQGLSIRQLKQHAESCISLAYAMNRYGGAKEANEASMSASDLFEALVTDEGAVELRALSGYAQANLDRTCRRLYRWRQARALGPFSTSSARSEGD